MAIESLKKKIKDKWFYFSIIILLIFFIIKLIDNSKMIWIYPFDKNHDLGAYMSLLFILTKYSFHQFVPYWCNGFILFQIYYPAWFYFTLPIYYITKNIGLTTFISFLLIYTLSFILIYILSKFHNISKIKRIAFFLFLFVNPITLGYILRIGRITELFSWMIFILFFILIIKYKDKPLDKTFLLFIPIFSLLLLSHHTAFIISTSFIFSILLVKRNIKNTLYVLFCVFLSLLVTAFWWVPYIKNIYTTPAEDYFSLSWIISSLPGTFMDKLSTMTISLIFLIVFYFYWKNKFKNKKEFLFFLPQLLLAILILFRTLPFIPFYNRVAPDSYNILFTFLSLFLFFKTKFIESIKKIIILLLFILPIIGILLTLIFTPNYNLYSDIDKDIIDLLKDVDGKLFIYEFESGQEYIYGQNHVYYGYATIYYNLSTPMSGTPVLLTKELINKNNLAINYLNNGNCTNLSKMFKELTVENIIAIKEKCKELINCEFILKQQNKNACLFSLK